MFATVSGGKIYITSDSGNSWTPKESNRNWSAITCSANGGIGYATVNGGSIWKYTDSGDNWTEINTRNHAGEPNMSTPRNWSAITCNSTGRQKFMQLK